MENKIISGIDGLSYSRANGHFTRHLKSHDLTYQEYHEKYVLLYSPRCPHCQGTLKFYQNKDLYAKTCGVDPCRGLAVASGRSKITKAQYQDIDARKVATNLERYGAAKYQSRLANNLKKKQACEDAGYKFEFWIFDSDKNRKTI
jgi:hypothetical protein